MRELLRRLNTEQVMKRTNAEEVTYEEAERFIKDPESFAQRLAPAESEPIPGLSLKQRTIELGDGHFTNQYDLSFEQPDDVLDARVITLHHPLYQHRLFSTKSFESKTNEEVVATINGAFFYLQDDPLAHEPLEIMYNLNIRDGKIFGLPATDRPALVTNHEGDLRAIELKAEGSFMINGTNLAWKGGEPIAHDRDHYSLEPREVYVFNAACCTIDYDDPNDKRTLRRVKLEKNRTPLGPDRVDVIVTTDSATGALRVTGIQKGGGTDFFAGNFVIQGRSEDLASVTIGSELKDCTIGILDPKMVASAMTVGPMVHHFLDHDDHPINHDSSLGSFPPFAARERYARSVVYADNGGKVHFVVFDGVPRSQFMKGASPHEVAKSIPSDAAWAVFLDGGQSSRITYRAGDEVDARGNQQYVRLHKLAKAGQGELASSREDQYLWTRRGREVPSVVTVSRKIK